MLYQNVVSTISIIRSSSKHIKIQPTKIFILIQFTTMHEKKISATFIPRVTRHGLVFQRTFFDLSPVPSPRGEGRCALLAAILLICAPLPLSCGEGVGG